MFEHIHFIFSNVCKNVSFIIKFIDNSSILSGVVVVSATGALLYFVLRKPNLELYLEVVNFKDSNIKHYGFILENKSGWQYYDSNEIYYHVFVPTSILSRMQFVDGIGTGSLPVNIDGVSYTEVINSVSQPLFPDRTVQLFSFKLASIEGIEKFGVYYYYSTKYGNCPRRVKSIQRYFRYHKINIHNIDKIRPNLPKAKWREYEKGAISGKSLERVR